MICVCQKSASSTPTTVGTSTGASLADGRGWA